MEKILLITGASSDVGIELLKKIYGNYDLIYLQYRQMNEGLDSVIQTINQETKLYPIAADFMKNEDILNLIQQIKDNALLPNNIVHLPSPKAYNMQFHKDAWENYEAGWQISFHSIVEILHAFLPNMAKQKYGRIIFMLTSCTINLPAKYQSSYVSVKYALLGLLRSLSVEYIDKYVTVNGVSPDMMETKFLSELPEMLVNQNAYNSPIKRNIKVEEVIPVFEWLLSDLAASTTGQNIGITGGVIRK